MVNFYVKNETGEFVEPTQEQIDEFYKDKSAAIISAKLADDRRKYRAKIEPEIRKEISDELKKEVRDELEKEYQPKLSKAEADLKDLDVKLRRKTIAAEYGFKPDTEEFLGDGDDESMRARADRLKDSFGGSTNSELKDIDKETTEPDRVGCVTLCK